MYSRWLAKLTEYKQISLRAIQCQKGIQLTNDYYQNSILQ